MPTLLERRSEVRAERLMQREYEELRAPTLRALRSRLSAQGIRFDDADLDAFYNQAWHGLYEQLSRGEEIENRGGFLVLVSYRRAIEELRRLQPERRADGAAPGEQGQDLDLAQRLDDRRRLLGAMEGMRERLSDRERKAAALCYLHGYSRPEAAAALGLAPKRMEKLMDGVSSKLGAITTAIDEGDWCESRQSLMKAYAYGVLDPDGERCALARVHLDECPACRRYVRGVRGIAAVVPPIWIPLLGLGAVGVGGAAAAGGAAHAGSGGSAAGGGAGGGGLTGGWGLAAAAGVAVVAGGIGTWAVVYDGGDPARPPTRPPAAIAPAGATASSSASPSSATAAKASASARSKARAARAAARRRSAAGGSTAASRNAASAQATPPASPPGTPTGGAPTAPTPATQPAPAPRPASGADPEFGFER